MKIQILGGGCTKCKKLAEITEKAAQELQIKYSLEKITDMSEIMKFNIIQTPALVIDGEIKFYGKVPSFKEVIKFLQ